jgi:MFS family permease
VFGTVMAVGFTAGVLLGGVLTGLAGWRCVFFVNVPIGTLALLGGARLLPTQPVRSGRWRLDIAGALLGTAAMAALVASLARTAQPNGGWQQAEVLAVIAAVLLVAFIAAERAAVDPLVPFGIFRCVGLTGANVVAALTLAIGSALAFTLTLVVQGFLGHSAMATGLIFLPAGIGGLVGGALAGRVIGLAGVRSTALAGLLVLASGTVIVLELGLGGSLGWLAGGYAIAGVGIVGLVVTTTIAATTGPGAARHGLAAGLLTTSQQLGAAVGPALAAVLAAPATLAAYSTSLSADLLLMVGAAVIAVVTLGTPKFAVEAEIERRSSAA